MKDWGKGGLEFNTVDIDLDELEERLRMDLDTNSSRSYLMVLWLLQAITAY